jgi:MFS family permease
VGALGFGRLTDRFGRKKLFVLTLGLYLAATVATAFSLSAWWFFGARLLTGAGIGGEYAAINSAIDELIPARVRGRVNLLINGTYWLGSARGSAPALVFLDRSIFPAWLGWRLAFGIGVVLGLGILLVRRHVPESPRWLFIHGREQDAERIVGDIERDVASQTGAELEEPGETLTIRQRRTIPFRTIAHTAFTRYPRERCSGWRCSSGRRSSTTASPSTSVPCSPRSTASRLAPCLASAGSSAAYLTVSEIFPMETRALAIAFFYFYAIGTAVGGITGPLLFGQLINSHQRGPVMVGFFIGAAVMAVGGVIELLFGVAAERASLESIAQPLSAD